MREWVGGKESTQGTPTLASPWISKSLGSHSPECRQAGTWEALSLSPRVVTKEELPHLTFPGEMGLLNRGCQG